MTVNWELYDSKLGKLKDVELARLIGSTPHRIRRRREQLGIAPWSVGQKIEPYKHLLGYTTDRAIAAQCGVSSKSVKAYRESLGILPVFRPVPRKQALPLNHDLRPYKPLFGFVSDQEIAQLAGADLAVVQDIREALGFEPVPPVPGSSPPTADCGLSRALAGLRIAAQHNDSGKDQPTRGRALLNHSPAL